MDSLCTALVPFLQHALAQPQEEWSLPRNAEGLIAASLLMSALVRVFGTRVLHEHMRGGKAPALPVLDALRGFGESGA